MQVRVFNIEWDCDEEDRSGLGLPEEDVIEIPVEEDDNLTDEELQEIISDTLSEMYGFCHNGFMYDIIEN